MSPVKKLLILFGAHWLQCSDVSGNTSRRITFFCLLQN